MKVHNVFHVSLLDSATVDTTLDRIQDEDLVIHTDNSTSPVLTDILDSRRTRFSEDLEYLVIYSNGGYDDRVWVPYRPNLEQNLDMVDAFHVKYPSRPKPLRIRLRAKLSRDSHVAAAVHPCLPEDNDFKGG